MNNYYVYIHRRCDNDAVFYLGHGNNKRAFSKERSPEWKAITDVTGYSVEYLDVDLSKTEAKFLENQYLNNIDFSWSLVNKKKAEDYIDYNSVQWNEYVEYSESSPTYLRWKIKIGRGDKVRFPGDTAGVIGFSKTGVKRPTQISVNGTKYFVHRIIWVMMGNPLDPNMVINHKDCNPQNNSYTNLEVCTHQENARRRKEHLGLGLNSRNKTGVNGVGKYKHVNTTYYKSYCYINSKLVSKSFSIDKYGEQEAFRLACEWRKEQIRLLNEQGAGYTDRHGT